MPVSQGSREAFSTGIPAPVSAPAKDRVSPVRAKENARSLKAPRDHRPLTRKVNPLFTGIARQQSGQRKRERNGESRIPGIQIRRMDDHFRILQQWSQAVAVAASDKIHRAIGARNRKRFEGAGDEIIERQEKNLNAGENHSHVRHQFAVFIPVGNQDRENVNRKEEAPEKKRAFLASPQRSDFIKRSECAVAMGDNVCRGKIVTEEEIFQTERGDKNQAAGCDTRLPRALNKKWMAGDDRRDPASECIHRTNKRQDKSE